MKYIVFFILLMNEQVKKGVDDQPVLGFVRDLYHDLGVQDFTAQLDMAA